MKEVTEWNGKPRWMWCWDDRLEHKRKDYVFCILDKEQMKDIGPYVVRTYSNSWKHCAEITEKEPERMTRRELSWWLRDHPEEHREWKDKYGCVVFSNYMYVVDDENEPCAENILIRSNGGEWREPYNIPPECISPTPDEIGG